MTAAYLHDIGRAIRTAPTEISMPKRGADGRPIIEELPLSPGQEENDLHAVCSHRIADRSA
jgi:HD superfamily phosphodiesterase